MITIFFNDKPIYLIDESKRRNSAEFYDVDEIHMDGQIKKLENNEIDKLVLISNDLNELFKKFKGHFKVIKAAGGIIENDKGEILFIYRNNKWDLPKGKIEKNEKIEMAALREATEECGIQDLKLEREYKKTYHIYKDKGKYILKETYWFLMYSNYNGKFKPQTEEGITKVNWISKYNLTKVFDNTYENIALLLKEYIIQ